MKSSTEIPNTKHAGRARHSVRAVSRPPDDGAQVTRPTLQDALPYRLVVGCSMLVVGCFPLLAQYSMDWSKISGGGGTSTNGQYSLSGTIGQPDAGGAMTNNQYSVTGGFWSLIQVVQTPGVPDLVIAHSGNTVTVSWPNTGSFTLQQNANVANSVGWATSGYSVTTANGTNSITITSPVGNLFFRLEQP